MGDSGSAFAIGLLYYYGEGVEQDYDSAMQWFKKAVDLDEENGDKENGYAMYLIGTMYYSGEGVEQDYDIAKDWFDKAVEAGYMGELGEIPSN